jgi:hypothetical protein
MDSPEEGMKNYPRRGNPVAAGRFPEFLFDKSPAPCSRMPADLLNFPIGLRGAAREVEVLFIEDARNRQTSATSCGSPWPWCTPGLPSGNSTRISTFSVSRFWVRFLELPYADQSRKIPPTAP